jgi:hypothetical protein
MEFCHLEVELHVVNGRGSNKEVAAATYIHVIHKVLLYMYINLIILLLHARTIQSVSTDVSEVGHGVTKTRVAGPSLNRPHKLKITLQIISQYQIYILILGRNIIIFRTMKLDLYMYVHRKRLTT